MSHESSGEESGSRDLALSGPSPLPSDGPASTSPPDAPSPLDSPTLGRALNVAIVLLALVLAAQLLGPRLRPAPTARAAPPPPPSAAELHEAAWARLAAKAPDAEAAFERARAALQDPEARALYGQALELLRARRPDLAEAAFAVALRREREAGWEF